jgi:beta-galactosidase
MFKTLYFLLILFSLSADAVNGLQAREVFLLDDEWRFELGDYPQANARDFADCKWRVVNLPHDWSIEGTTAADAPSQGDGGYFPTGIGWYRRELIADSSWRDKRVWLDFEGVATRCTVWLNGKKLGGHHYAYTPIHFDITEQLAFDKPNVIAVRVDNSHQPNSRWYTGSGIYRHVWLTVVEPVHISDTKIATVAILPTNAAVEISTSVGNDLAESRQTHIEIEVLDPGGKSLVELEDAETVPAGKKAEVKHKIRVPNPRLWSPEEPNLYTAVVRVVDDKTTLDEVRTSFGIRTVAVSPERGLELNGQPIKLFGGCVHHDNGPLGAAAFDRAEIRRVEIMKAAGFNAIRTSHNPPSTAFLDACDRLGMLVIDEAFDGWKAPKKEHDYSTVFDEEWQNDLRAMIDRDRNHPSVVMWSIGNEVYERGDPPGAKIARDMVRFVRDLDSTRPITLAANGIGDDAKWPQLDGLFAPLDVAGYNYEVDRIVPDHDRLPNRVIFVSESFQSEAFACWDAARKNSFMIGDFVWSGLDYLGEAGIGRVFAPDEEVKQHWEASHFPWHGAYCGDIDITGWRKPISHYRNIVWQRGEKLYVAVVAPTSDGRPWGLGWWAMPTALPSWGPDAEGRELQVEVYSRHEAVRLYLNDKLIGEKPTGRAQEFKATFAIPYAPGTLKASGIENGKEVETYEIVTAGPTRQLRLRPDRAEIRADGQDLCFVTVEVTDEQGNWCPLADDTIEYNLVGPGTIAAVGSGDLTSREPYQANPRKVYQGRGLIVVRSSGAGGTLTLTAQSPGLEPASVDIHAR